MNGLIIAAGIAALLLAMLLSPAVLSFSYDDGVLKVKLRYLLLSVDLSPDALAQKAEKKVKKQAGRKPAEAKPEAKEKPGKKTSVTLSDLWALLKATRRAVNVIRRNLVFYKIKVTVVVGGPDAHAIGEKYAAYGVIIPRLIGLLDLIFTAVEPQVLVMPNFLREKSYWNVAFKARIAPWHLLAAAWHMLVRFIRISLKNKKKREKIKGGKRHEPTASHK